MNQKDKTVSPAGPVESNISRAPSKDFHSTSGDTSMAMNPKHGES